MPRGGYIGNAGKVSKTVTQDSARAELSQVKESVNPNYFPRKSAQNPERSEGFF